MMKIEDLRNPGLGMIHVIVIKRGIERKVHLGIDHDLGKEKRVRRMERGIEVAGNTGIRIGIKIEKEIRIKRREMGGIVTEIRIEIGRRKENGKETVILEERNVTARRKVIVIEEAGVIQLDIGKMERGIGIGNTGREVGIGSFVRRVGTESIEKRVMTEIHVTKRADLLEQSSDGHSGK